MNENDYEFMKKVKERFEVNGSIRLVAKEFGLSRTKVRKILITLGVIESEITKEALSLKNSGMDIADIAKKLGHSVSTISTYLPYDTVFYNGESKSSGAIRNEKYRERNKIVAEKQIQRIDKEKKDWREEMKKKEFKVLKLRMELDTEFADKEILKKYGKVKEGIIREVLVPSSMTIHALHFAIQRCFGWQNSHLHHFLLPDNIFSNLTQNSFLKWLDYCGIYFRFPSDDYQDIYWDDDYKENESVKSWFRKKYTGPYHYYGITENFMEARARAEIFVKENRQMRIISPFKEWIDMSEEERQKPIIKMIEDITCDEMKDYFIEEGGLCELLERLKVEELLGVKASEEELEELLEEADIRFNENNINAKNEREYYKKMKNLNKTALPLTKELLYEYDYGDGWQVKITLEDEYCIDDETIEGELKDQITKVIDKERPICIMADGLPVLDDVGGMDGYCEMLMGVNGEGSKHYDYDNPEETKEWARMLGWTGRMNKPEHVL